MATIGERLTKARLERNVTQKQLANHFHIPQSTISMIEQNELGASDGVAHMIEEWIKSGAGVETPGVRGARGRYG